MLKPTLLFVGNFLSSTGGNRSVTEELSERLLKSGYSVITTSNRRSRLWRLLDMVMTMLTQRVCYQVASVEVYSGPAFFWAEMVGWVLDRLRKPYVLTLHGGNLPVFARRWPGRVRRLLKAASGVTAPSLYLRHEMRQYRQDIILIPNPLDLENYPYRIRTEAKPQLVWLRAFHKIYNPQMAPLVIAGLCKDYPEISLTMIGPDKGDGSLQETQRIIEKLGLQKYIEIVQGIPKRKVPEYLQGADIFINTTNIDNTPVSVLEAMACGLCVVSTNVGGIPYLLEDGYDAFLVDPRHPEAMVEAIHEMLAEPSTAKCLSLNARRKVEQFDWSAILPQWEKFFQEVLHA